MNRVRVLTLNAALGLLDYRQPEGMTLPIGTVVEVPLGPRTITGIVWDDDAYPADDVPDAKLRAVKGALDLPPLSTPLRKLIDWTADYYCAHPSHVARMAMPPSAALRHSPTMTEYRLTGSAPSRMTAMREQAMAALEGQQGTARELATAAEVSEGVIRGLVKTGALEPIVVTVDRPYPAPNPNAFAAQLNDHQKAAADAMCAAVKEQDSTAFMLDGVTGSGKTETYFAAIAEALRMGRQTLILLPEIALTQPFLTRFEEAFDAAAVCWHSGLKQAERRRAWRAIASGNAMVTVGARSSLFLPYANLGLIIVDEAHETSFKQEDGVRYNARDVAVMRGRFASCPVVLASATPAIETRHMADSGVYETLTLPSRFGEAVLPEIKALDLTEDPPERGTWLAPTLITALEETLERQEQALLFLNRRGYAPLTLCRHCGDRITCPHCSAWMVEHRLTRKLACHHCGETMPIPDTCPECGTEDSLVACGPGVERIAEEVAARFPTARTAIVTSDTIWSPDKAAQFVAEVEQGAIDIIIGTQLVTKGYHFPELTLVGVIDADVGLTGGDLRGSERSFQQIAQVAGRAGRGAKPGTVLVQTHCPNDPVIDALVRNDREAFYEAEIAARRDAMMPPFGRLAAIIISSEDNSEALAVARALGQNAPHQEDVYAFGPAPAPLSMLRGRYRHRLLVQAKRTAPLQRLIRDWLETVDWPRAVRVGVDIDPYSFL